MASQSLAFLIVIIPQSSELLRRLSYAAQLVVWMLAAAISFVAGHGILSDTTNVGHRSTRPLSCAGTILRRRGLFCESTGARGDIDGSVLGSRLRRRHTTSYLSSLAEAF